MTNTLFIDLFDNSLEDYYKQMEKIFGLPRWWGRNWHALFDCLSTLRGPADDKLTLFLLKEEDTIILKVANIEKAKFDINLHLFSIIAGINQFFQEMDGHSVILLDIRDGFKYTDG